MTSVLYLVRLSIDSQKLYAFAKRSGAAARDFDAGYAVHALFAALFDHGVAGDNRVAPKPFHIVSGEKSMMEVLGYAPVDHSALVERANTFADPLAWGVCDLGGVVSKPMPSAFESGTILGFSTRACPIRRIAKRGPITRDRVEVDAFLARAWELGPSTPLDRQEVYNSWLGEELAKDGAAKLVHATMENFHLGRLHRRTQGDDRKGHRTQRPDVTFDGVLEVQNASAFGDRLRRGVGRHRAFGFGMLLLKPAKTR